MGFSENFRKVIGLDPVEEDDNITMEEIEAEKANLRKSEQAARKETAEVKNEFKIAPPSYYGDAESVSSTASGQSKSYSMNASGPFKMLVIEPKTFDECTKLVDNLKSRKPVIINLEKVETDLARKMFDFLSGATYALNGNVQRVTSNIFIFAPANVDIAAKLNRTASTENSAPGNKSNRWE